MSAWAETLKPGSSGEAEVVARIADLNFRLRRLQRLEDKRLAASLESKLAGSEASRRLTAAETALKALQAMVETLGTLSGEYPVDAVRGLASAISATLDMVDAVGLAKSVLPLKAAQGGCGRS